MLILQTTRLDFRHPVPQDLDSLYALYRDPEMRRYYPEGTLSREQTKNELEVFFHGHPEFPKLGLWATEERRTGAFLGRCGLLPWIIEGKHEVELAFLIDKARWREGFATEAALGIIEYAGTVLLLQRLICLIMPGNTASVRVAEKAGMCFERELVDEQGLCHVYARSCAPGKSKLSGLCVQLD